MLVFATAWIVCPAAAAQQTDPATTVRFHTEAAPADSAMIVNIPLEDVELRLNPVPAVDLRAAAGVRVVPDVLHGGYQLVMSFTDVGRARFHEVTTEIAGQRLAVFVEGQFTKAPTIKTGLRGPVPIKDGIATEEAARELAARINAELKALSSPPEAAPPARP
jgi:preprotein translocase subunit SecD